MLPGLHLGGLAHHRKMPEEEGFGGGGEGGVQVGFFVSFFKKFKNLMESCSCPTGLLCLSAELCREAVHSAERALQKGDLGDAACHDYSHGACHWRAQAADG